MPARIEWHGDEWMAKIKTASKAGIDQLMSVCVIDAKLNHPGWINRTGTAEGSVRIAQFAGEAGTRIVGVWGSVGCNYTIWLELKHGSFLRSSADRNYKSLTSRIKANLNV